MRNRNSIDCGSITGTSHPADLLLTKLDEQRAINRAKRRAQQQKHSAA